MESYIAKVNKRLENTMHLTELNHHEINEILQPSYQDMRHLVTNIIHHSNIIERETKEPLIGVYSLLQENCHPS